jgi:hypothetical protein
VAERRAVGRRDRGDRASLPDDDERLAAVLDGIKHGGPSQAVPGGGGGPEHQLQDERNGSTEEIAPKLVDLVLIALPELFKPIREATRPGGPPSVREAALGLVLECRVLGRRRYSSAREEPMCPPV